MRRSTVVRHRTSGVQRSIKINPSGTARALIAKPNPNGPRSDSSNRKSAGTLGPTKSAATRSQLSQVEIPANARIGHTTNTRNDFRRCRARSWWLGATGSGGTGRSLEDADTGTRLPGTLSSNVMSDEPRKPKSPKDIRASVALLLLVIGLPMSVIGFGQVVAIIEKANGVSETLEGTIAMGVFIVVMIVVAVFGIRWLKARAAEEQGA